MFLYPEQLVISSVWPAACEVAGLSLRYAIDGGPAFDATFVLSTEDGDEAVVDAPSPGTNFGHFFNLHFRTEEVQLQMPGDPTSPLTVALDAGVEAEVDLVSARCLTPLVP